MTNSFQSTAFQSATSPIDTFVQPVTVQPKSGAEELAEILEAVNPALQKFIGQRIEDKIKEDKSTALKLAADTVLADGTVGKAINKIRKEDGDEAAKQTIGGSFFVKRFYKQYVGELYGSQLLPKAKEAYKNAVVDITDDKGNLIQKPLKEFSTSDEEYINWRKNYFAEQTQKVIDLGGEINSKNFINNLTNSVLELDTLATETHNNFNVEQVKSLSNDYLNKAVENILDGDKESAKIDITNFINDTRKLGLTGSDASEIYGTMIDSIADIGEYLATTADVNDLDDLDDSLETLGQSIPYGNNNGTLVDHPDWKGKIAPVLEKIEDELNEELTQGPKIQKALRTIRLEKELDKINSLPIETEEDRLIYKEEITKLKNNREYSDLHEIFKSNNYAYIENFTAEILNIRSNMKFQNYKDNETPQKDLAIIKNKMVDLGITDNSLITDLEQAIGISKEYKSIYKKFDTLIQPLLTDMDNFYRSKASNNGTFGGISLGNGMTVNVGGLDNDTFIEKYKNEQELDRNFEKWINENYYLKKDNFLGGPSQSDFEEYIKQERERVEKDIFKIDDTPKPKPKPKPINSNETPAFGNQKFEVDNVMNFENRRGAGYGGGMPVEFNLQELLNQENFPDFGGLAELVRGGESLGSGLYNAFNGGTTDTAGEMDITSKTIGEMEQMQADGKVFAVGAYQFTPNVLTEARVYSGLSKDDIMTPENQDRLFWGMLLSGRKRPSLAAYLTGQSDDLNAAHEDLALEFAAIQGPDGKGMYDNDKAGNFARIDANLVREALINARNLLMNR